MRKYSKIQKTIDVENLDIITCDICHREIDQNTELGPSGRGDFSEVKIYGSKIMTYIKSLGVTFTKTEEEW